jgi:hypothetical protein
MSNGDGVAVVRPEGRRSGEAQEVEAAAAAAMGNGREERGQTETGQEKKWIESCWWLVVFTTRCLHVGHPGLLTISLFSFDRLDFNKLLVEAGIVKTKKMPPRRIELRTFSLQD